MRLITVILASFVLASCVTDAAPPPIVAQPGNAAVCAALDPALPFKEIAYHGTKDTPDTVARIQANNAQVRDFSARYRVACP